MAAMCEEARGRVCVFSWVHTCKLLPACEEVSSLITTASLSAPVS